MSDPQLDSRRCSRGQTCSKNARIAPLDVPLARSPAHSSYAFASVRRSLFPEANFARALAKSSELLEALSNCTSLLIGLLPLVHRTDKQRFRRETRRNSENRPQTSEDRPQDKHLGAVLSKTMFSYHTCNAHTFPRRRSMGNMA